MTQPCPRQTNEATLSIQREHVSHWRADGTCSYCGSVSPERLFAAIEAGMVLEPTDKDYKVYLRTESGDGQEQKFYFQHLSVEERHRFIGLMNEKRLKLGLPGHFYVLPFFVQREARPSREKA